MSFRKIRFGQEEIFTTVVEDLDGREIERWRVHKRDYPKVAKILSKKFGLNAKIIINDNKQKEDKDLDWLK